jgi:RNA polymerase sigma-70 factor, ECF subfamily
VPNTEKLLAERAAKRDCQAFAQLYDLYADKIYKYIYYKNGRTDEAEDLTAQVFLKAWEAIQHYKWEGYPFSTWLYRIAHNQMIDYYRTHHETWPLDTARAKESTLDPFEAAERTFASDQIHSALKHLTHDQQRVIVLRFLEGYSTSEVAAMMDKDADAIRALQHRALRALEPWMSEARAGHVVSQPHHAAVGA